MTAFLLPDLKITEESQNADIAELIKIIKPSWNLEKLQIKVLSGGFSSRMFRCYDENNSKDSVTIRVRQLFDKITKDELKNPLELKILQHLSMVGHFPKIHAVFANGYCYQYIRGKPMMNVKEKTGHVDDRKLRSIAEEMAFIHSIKLDDEDYSEKNTYMFITQFFQLIDTEKPIQNGLTKKRILLELEKIKSFLKNLNPNIVLCHGDLHPGNCVWNENEGKLTFVDWEGAHIGYQLSEIAHLLIAIKLTRGIYSKQKLNELIEKGYEYKFVKYYISAWKKKNHSCNEETTDEEIKEWMENIEIFSLVPMMTLALNCCVLPEIFKEFSQGETLADEIIDDYLKLKEKFLGQRSFETE